VKIVIIGTGRIGGGLARQLAGAGHELKLSFSRDPGKLSGLARELGAGASVGTPAEAVDFGEVIVISVPWACCHRRSSRRGRSPAESLQTAIAAGGTAALAPREILQRF